MRVLAGRHRGRVVSAAALLFVGLGALAVALATALLGM
jgi:hypothetical protein